MELLFLNESWSWSDLTLKKYINEGSNTLSDNNFSYFFEKEDVQQELNTISDFLEKESKRTSIFPSINHVFRALYLTPLQNIKLVILGQDPYHNEVIINEIDNKICSAVGLCFSVASPLHINPSLRNIYTELENEGFKPKKDGNLVSWAKNGILLLNTALTVAKGEPESHIENWWNFSEKLITYISENTNNVAWLLMGSKALEFQNCINKNNKNNNNKIFVTSHPSPLSAHRSFKNYPAFLGSGIFKKLCEYLKIEIFN